MQVQCVCVCVLLMCVQIASAMARMHERQNVGKVIICPRLSSPPAESSMPADDVKSEL